MAEQLPDLLTVEEAARVLRIGRTAAYGLARTWRATGGREGLPVVNLGRLLRVPRAALESITGAQLSQPYQAPAGRAHPARLASKSDKADSSRVTSAHSRATKRRSPRSSAQSNAQDSLPF